MDLLDRGCLRCGQLVPLQVLGLLWLCAACFADGIAAPCGDFAHNYVGSATGWLCLRCGALLGTTPISTAVVDAPKPAVPDLYC